MTLTHTVVAADGSTTVLDAIEEVLRARSITVRTFVNGKSALESVLRDQPDVLIIDVDVAEMNGLEVLRAVRHGGHHLPVILMGQHLSSDQILGARSLKASAILAKPFDMDSLEQAFDSALPTHGPVTHDADVIDRTFKRLYAASAKERTSAIADFSEMNITIAIPDVVAALMDVSARVRLSAAKALGDFKEFSVVVHELMNLVRDIPLDDARKALEGVITFCGAPFVMTLEQTLSVKDPVDRLTAQALLEKITEADLGEAFQAAWIETAWDPTP